MKKITDVLTFLDTRTRNFLIFSSLVGIIWFGVELSFVYILQGFLLSLKILSSNQIQVPTWFPLGVYQSTILLISFGIVRSAVNYLRTYFSIVIQHSFIKYCRNQIVEYGLDSNYFLSTGDFVSLFSDNVGQSGVFVQYLSMGIVSICSAFLFFLFGLFYAPKEMLFSLIITVVVMLPIRKMTQRIQIIGESLVGELKSINEDVLNARRNLFFLSVYNLIILKKDEIKKGISNYEHNYIHYATIVSGISSVPLFVGVTVLSLCTYLSINIFHTDGVKVLSFFYIFLRLVQSLSELNSTFGVLKFTYPFFSNVKKDIYKLSEIENIFLEQTKKINSQINFNSIQIKLNSISFSYSREVDSLFENLNLIVSRGDVLVIKGHSGSGKSTLLKLILGLDKPTQGEVLLNGVNVLSLSPEWKSHLGYVGPDPYLIKGSVKENLYFGNFKVTNFTEQDYWHALEMAEIKEDFHAGNIGLDTILSELGTLSTGQKQRIAIARAFLRKPSIVILDEATANLDPYTEKQIVENLEKLSKEVVTIIVTHKNSFDKIGTKFINLGVK